MTVYLDCNATTPIEPEVIDIMNKYLNDEFANAGSRTHEFGNVAKAAVEQAREKVGLVVGADKGDVIFTSGATEANNIAILGLEQYATDAGKKHIITTTIEHKAVLEPIAHLMNKGFEVTYLQPGVDGKIDSLDLEAALREDTFLVSIMHVNNETGAIQPMAQCIDVLKKHDAYFHVDAAQSFGKLLDTLTDTRIDLISCSAHKLFGPKGVGALINRRRKYKRVPLSPILFGGGQERGLRPGTLPVHQIAGFGMAAELAIKNAKTRMERCEEIKVDALAALERLSPLYHGSECGIASTLNFSIKDINSEAAIVALKGVAAVSNGSACTSSSYTPSHVLKAMGLSDDDVEGALRLSWCHLTEDPDWSGIVSSLEKLL